MAINLSKGQRVAIQDDLQHAIVGLGWDTNRYSGSAFDLDASVFMLGANEKLIRDDDFVFYNNKNGRDGAVVHSGDNLTGDGGGDDEQILIDFTKIPAEIQKLVICVTIHDAVGRKQNFGMVSNAYIRIAKMKDEFDSAGETVYRFDLEEEFSTETGLVVAEIYRKDGWKFKAVAGGVNNGLEELVDRYQ